MKLSEGTIGWIYRGVIEHLRKSLLPEICRYCDSAMLLPNGAAVSKEACEELQHVCNSCFNKIKKGEIRHDWN